MALSELGRLAQLVEQDVYTIEVRGSSPLPPTKLKAESEYVHAFGFLYFVRRGGLEGVACYFVSDVKNDTK